MIIIYCIHEVLGACDAEIGAFYCFSCNLIKLLVEKDRFVGIFAMYLDHEQCQNQLHSFYVLILDFLSH